MIILTLDTGTKTGWALYDKKVLFGNRDFSIEHDNGAKFMFFRAWLDTMLTVFKPDAVAYEMPHLRGSGTQLLVGFVTLVQELCTGHGIQWFEVHSATIKKFATNNGKATKQDMMDAYKKRFPKRHFKTDDECDALWLLEYILSTN